MSTPECIALETAALSSDMIRRIKEHIKTMNFDNRLDYLGEIGDFCEAKIQEAWDEELEDE